MLIGQNSSLHNIICYVLEYTVKMEIYIIIICVGYSTEKTIVNFFSKIMVT